MKKHDEGYVLAYVTVVLLVFCLVATTILTGAMKNLEHQQQAQAKMEDKYFAKGMIEQIIAQLDKKGDIFIDCNLFKQIAEDETVIAQVTATVEDGVLTLTAQKGNAAVTYRMKLKAENVSCSENQVRITGLTVYTFTNEEPNVDGGAAG